MVINKPAWKGIRPKPRPFDRRVPVELSEWLFKVLRTHYLPGLRGLYVCRGLQPSDGRRPFGHYYIKVKTGKGAGELYARVARPYPAKERRLLPQITHLLSGNGCNVQSWLGRVSSVSPVFIDSRSFAEPVQFTVSDFRKVSGLPPTPEWLKKAGSAVGRMHNVLSKASFSKEVRLVSEKRTGLFKTAKAEIKKNSISLFGNIWPAGYGGLMERLISGYSPDFMIADGLRKQVIHGDLNAGNLLAEDGKRVFITDFEDTTHSYYPCLVDIAFFTERFICFDNPAADFLKRRIRAFFSGYLTEARTPFSAKAAAPGAQLSEILKQINYYAVCALTKICLRDTGYPVASELNKFIALEKQALYYAPIMGRFGPGVFCGR